MMKRSYTILVVCSLLLACPVWSALSSPDLPAIPSTLSGVVSNVPSQSVVVTQVPFSTASTSGSGLSIIPSPISSVSVSLSVQTSALSSGLPPVVSSTTLGLSSFPTASFSVVAPSSPTYNTGTGTETGAITLPLSSYTFSPFPIPSPSPIPGVYPAANPSNLPSVSDSPGILPDFSQAWAAAYAKAKAKVAKFTIEQKVNVSTGLGNNDGRCEGVIVPIGDEWPGLCLGDAPLGVRHTDFVTVFPTGINTAATFNRTMMRLRGAHIGQEHKGKGVNVALGPMMNLGRIAQGGRNWEGFGADPFLSGEVAYETILGMQSSGVQAVAKHFINNEQEHHRMSESSNVDDRTEHELYAHPFLRSVQAGVAAADLVNDTFACENNKTLNNILKREFGFQGFVTSDWGAQQSTLSAVAGLDMAMPGDIAPRSYYWGHNLTAFVQNGTIPESRLTDMSTRILASWYFLGQDQNYPPVSINFYDPLDEATNGHVDVQDDHYKIVREIGAASVVLLKNVNGALPLNKPRNLVLVGSDAGPAAMGPNGYSDAGGDDGILAVGWGSGSASFPYLIDPLSAIQSRAIRDRTSVTWWLNDFDTVGAANAVVQQEVAIVCVNADSGEDYITVDGNEGDRKNLTLWHNADALIAAVASQNNNTIVVVHSVGPAIIEPWIDHPNVTAVLWAGIAGQETGNSLVDVLYGAYNPSGRLPYTIAKDPADYPAQLVTGGQPSDILSIPYTEGLFIDYRHFDASNITPRFEFGFGLSYTSFAYSSLEITRVYHSDHTSADLEAAWAAGKATPVAEGSSTALWLHRPVFQVAFDLENTGNVSGSEIPQLYVHMPSGSGEPPSVLRGFTGVSLRLGEKKHITITLSRYGLSYWDVAAQGWRKPDGKFTFSVGASSRDFRLHGSIPL